MKPILSKTKLLALLAVLSGTAVNAGDLPVSPTSGVIRVNLPNATTTAVAVPFAKSIPFEGTITAVSGTTLTLSTTTLTASALVGYSIYIPTNINGAAAIGTSAYGRLVAITANATNSVTTEVAITPTVGDAFQIIEPHTLSSLFGASPGTVALLTGSSATLSDIVYLESGGTFTGYFHRSGQGWRLLTDTTTSQNNVKINFGRGVLIARKGGTAGRTMNITGESLTGLFRPYTTPSNATSCVNNPFNVATTLGASRFNLSASRGSSAALSDVFYVENGGVFTGYWCKSGTAPNDNNWYLESDSTGVGALQNAVSITPGKAILFKDRGATAFTFALSQPFNP
jgi:hypothetical protein